MSRQLALQGWKNSGHVSAQVVTDAAHLTEADLLTESTPRVSIVEPRAPGTGASAWQQAARVSLTQSFAAWQDFVVVSEMRRSQIEAAALHRSYFLLRCAWFGWNQVRPVE